MSQLPHVSSDAENRVELNMNIRFCRTLRGVWIFCKKDRDYWHEGLLNGDIFFLAHFFRIKIRVLTYKVYKVIFNSVLELKN